MPQLEILPTYSGPFSESVGTVVFTIWCRENCSSNPTVSVNVTASNIGLTSGSAGTRDVVVFKNHSRGYFDVIVVDDATADGDGVITAEIVPDTTKYWIVDGQGSASITITENDAPMSSPGRPEPPEPPEAELPPLFTVYYDPDHSAESTARYEEAIDLLDAAYVDYSVRPASGTAEVDRLANVTNSVLPRFFLGDPTDAGWQPQAQVNNGGLRWLRGYLEELRE